MRFLLTLLFLLSQAGCSALLIGGGQSGNYPASEDSGQTQKDCDKYPDQEHCE